MEDHSNFRDDVDKIKFAPRELLLKNEILLTIKTDLKTMGISIMNQFETLDSRIIKIEDTVF